MSSSTAAAVLMKTNKTSICKICNDGLARYCCPRCNILYCTLKCYQSNSHWQCSEYFYKDNILEELNSNQEDTKTKMFKVLQNMRENVSLGDNNEYFGCEDLDSDDDTCADISDRLAGINLEDSEQVWNKLTEDEKQDFVAFLKSEDVTKLIPPWHPWWLYYNESTAADAINNETCQKKYPVIGEIDSIHQIMTKTPSQFVKYNLINIISAYSFTTRYFNGEHFDFAKEAVSCMISLSLTLKTAENFMDIETAIKSVEQECINTNWILINEDNLKIMKDDLYRILRGPTESENKFYLFCALYDLQNLMKEALKPVHYDKSSNFWKKFRNEHIPSVKLVTSATIKKYIRKIQYYLSFTKYCYDNLVLRECMELLVTQIQ